MLAGQKRYKYGYQVCLFPLDYLNCIQKTQTPSWSHCCGTATDWIGTTEHYPIYAPCDCHEVECNAADTKAYRSDKEVLTPLGVRYITFGFTHDDNPPTQTVFKQGELIAHTGNTGFSTQDHLHLDQTIDSIYYLVASGITCESGRECWELLGGVTVTDTFYLTGDETIYYLNGLVFQTITGGSSIPLDNELIAMIKNKRSKKSSKFIIR